MEENETLTPKEIKQIKSYCLMPQLAVPTLMSIFLMLFMMVILCMVDDIHFDARFVPYRDFLSYFAMGLAFVLLIVLICFILIPRIGMNGRKWAVILSKLQVQQQTISGRDAAIAGIGLNAMGRRMSKSDNDTVSGMGTAAQVAGAAASAVAVHQMTRGLYQNASAVAKAWNIPIKRPKAARILTLILPSLLMTALYIPEFSMSAQATQQRVDHLTQIADQIEMTMGHPDQHMFKPEVNPGMRSYSMFFREEKLPGTPEIQFDIHESGVVTELKWSMVEDPGLTPEENLEIFQNYVDSTVQQAKSCPVEFWSKDFEVGSRLQGELVQKYLQDRSIEHLYEDVEEGNTRYVFTIFESYDGERELIFSVKETDIRR